MEHLPLFPLNLVMFPGTRSRLHIFEDRYKLLIARCIEHDTEFGVLYVNDGNMSNVGCTVKVVETTKRYPDGKSDIIVEGISRFDLVYSERSDEDLLIGEIRRIVDHDDPTEPDMIRRAVELYNTLVSAAYKGRVPKLEAEEEIKSKRAVSYVLAEKAGLEIEDRQELLELRSESERLRIMTDYMQKTIPSIIDFERIQKIVANDGYLPRKPGN
jgi:ATP-dependent Lon protease